MDDYVKKHFLSPSFVLLFYHGALKIDRVFFVINEMFSILIYIEENMYTSFVFLNLM